MSVIKALIVSAFLCTSGCLLSGCGIVALAGVAYMMGKDTGTHVMQCSKTDTGETVCHDTEKGALQR
jgi:hypothetical protein